jgi:hypothetical protein
MELVSSRLSLEDDVEEISNYFHAQGYTDGLPIIPPTAARVERMIAGSGLHAAHSLGHFPPAEHDTTIEKVAINAVMAGCKPEYMPVIVAAIECMMPPEWQLGQLQSTTNPLTPMLIVNGPIRNKIGLNCDTGAMGPGWQANSAIGRAIRLIMLNLGGAAPGDVDKCTQGFVGKFGMCVGENEENSPWEPYHVSLGYDAEESVVTTVGVNASTNIHDSSDNWQDVFKTVTGTLIGPETGNVVDPDSTPVVAFNPIHARLLADAGYTRAKLLDHFFENCRTPAASMSARRLHLRRADHPEKFDIDGMIPFTWERHLPIVITLGGWGGGQSCYLPNGHYGHAATRKIREVKA